jgi:hypothetical protein
VVVVLGEVLGELVAGVVAVRHDPVDHADLLEHAEVAVGGAGGEPWGALLQLGDRERSPGPREHVDEVASGGRHPLSRAAEAGGDDVVELGPGFAAHGRRS